MGKEDFFKDMWNLISVESDESTDKSLQSVKDKINSTEEGFVRRKYIHYKNLRKAAVFILPLLSAFLTYFFMNNGREGKSVREETGMLTCIVPEGGNTRTVLLPDSSIVRVNAGSMLVYPEKFFSSRKVVLNGEAYFSVKRDEKKPFIVETQDFYVRVLGTVFDVCSYSEEKTSFTTLQKGKVDIQFKNSSLKPLVLLPNQQVYYDRLSKSVEKKTVNVADFTAWTKGQLIIQSMTIGEISDLIGRKYGKKVFLTSGKYNSEKITLKVTHGENLNEFMSLLHLLLPGLKYRENGNELYIY